ncbi:MAG TPA: ATP-binding protein [Thermoanaerobaculia bacterium]|nr:ATP-binding protein [Thermoanaerobaculia bacterium]
MSAALHGAAVEDLPAIASAKVYTANGALVSQYVRPAQSVPFASLAARLAPSEVTCNSGAAGFSPPNAAGGLKPAAPYTLCVESSPAAIAPTVQRAATLLLVSAILGLAVGWLGGLALARAVAAPQRRIAEVLDKAAREYAYSLRVEESSPLAASVNQLLAQMQERDVELRRRTTEIEAANKELEAFAYSVSHDLRAPLGSIDGFSSAIELDYSDRLDDTAREYLSWIRKGCAQMRDLIDGLLQMSRLSRADVQREAVDLSAIARNVAGDLQQRDPARNVHFEIHDGVRAVGDERLLHAVVENLMSNAWKFTRERKQARIEFGSSGGAYYVRDNGAGFDPSHASKMFRPFQRLHSSREFEGMGIGLATVQKIVERHGGRAWAEGEVEQGATIYFTIDGWNAAVPAADVAASRAATGVGGETPPDQPARPPAIRRSA